jgi:YD repeat-containing protein
MERRTPGFARTARRALVNACVLILASSIAVAAVITYQHDAQGRVSTATYDNGTVVTYSYDSNGNRIGASVTPDSSPPTTPTGLTATSISSARIDLSWVPGAALDGLNAFGSYKAGDKLGATLDALSAGVTLTMVAAPESAPVTLPAWASLKLVKPTIKSSFMAVCMGNASPEMALH